MTHPAPDKTHGFCRDCLAEQKGEARRCTACGSPRVVPRTISPEITHPDNGHAIYVFELPKK